MTIWKCPKCGYTKESRCEQKKCPTCGDVKFLKIEEKSSCGCGGCGCR